TDLPLAVPGVSTPGESPSPTLAPSPQRIPTAKRIDLASPQASPQAPVKPGPPHKRWSLVAWARSLHQQEPPTRPYLPPALFPTSYQASVVPTAQAAPQPSSQRCETPVRPAPQQILLPTSVPAASKSYFSWVGNGPVTGFFRKLKSWSKGCGCCCHHGCGAAARAVTGPCGG